jgi:phosphoribosylformimino-5-aminoimidazole carboxamide ribotide isomerase
MLEVKERLDMEIFPAIDLKNGMVVRLTHGDFNQMDVYSEDPVRMAESFKKQGARNLHVVDLDGAKEGTPINFSVISDLVKAGGLYVEVGGGIRDEARINQYLELGVGRVILGTVVVENFDFTCRMIKKYGDKIAAGVDARSDKVATRGWLNDTKMDAADLCGNLSDAGISAIIYTDIARDGAMQGANIDAYRRLCKNVDCPIIASGGISSIEELTLLDDIGVYGAILGKALYTGTLNLKDVIERC